MDKTGEPEGFIPVLKPEIQTNLEDSDTDTKISLILVPCYF